MTSAFHCRLSRVVGAALLCQLVSGVAWAEPSRRFGYQGRLEGASGETEIRFCVAPQGQADCDYSTTYRWREAQTLSLDSDGRFSVVIGDSSTGLDEIPFEDLKIKVLVGPTGGPFETLGVLTPSPAPHATSSSRVVARAITDEQLAPRSVTTAALDEDAVSNEHLLGSSVTAEQLGVQSIGSRELGTGAIIEEHIRDGEVKARHVSYLTLTASDFGEGSVTRTHIINFRPVSLKDDAVVRDRIEDESVTHGEFERQYWTSDELLSISGARTSLSLGENTICGVWKYDCNTARGECEVSQNSNSGNWTLHADSTSFGVCRCKAVCF